MRNRWLLWISKNWRALCAKERLFVPQTWLRHPQFVEGFKPVRGWPAGQLCDWGLSLSDGSRVHVQCYRHADGTEVLVAHRDRWDPTIDPAHAAMHLFFETPARPVLGLAAVTAVLVLVVQLNARLG